MTVVTCYQVADEDSQRALLSSRLPVAGTALNAGKAGQLAQGTGQTEARQKHEAPPESVGSSRATGY